jgi:hypothetical protein
MAIENERRFRIKTNAWLRDLDVTDHIVIAHIYLNSYRVLHDILHNSNVFRDLTPWDTKRKPSTLLGLSERIML